MKPDIDADTEGRAIGAADVLALPITDLAVPYRALTAPEHTLALGFRQTLVDVDDLDASVTTGAGCGTDFIILQFGEEAGLIRGSELLKRWIGSFDPDTAAKLPGPG